MNLLSQIAAICGCITSIAAAVCLLVKPIRESIFGMKQVKEGQKCLLRSDMLRTFYRHNEKNTIRQYEFENFMLEYNAYKQLGGNSFIDRVKDEVKTWEVTS